jgi:hypothetical protein
VILGDDVPTLCIMSGPVIHGELLQSRVPVDQLTPHPANPNRGDVDLISTSLGEFGQYRPIVYQRSTNHILAGNHTWQAVKKLGGADIAAIGLDVDDDTAARILAADNGTRDRAHYDHDALRDLLDSLSSLDGTGYTIESLSDLAELTAPPDLDALAEEVGDFAAKQAWPSVRISCPPMVAEAWKAHLSTYSGDDAAAFARLLGVDDYEPAP